MHIPRLYRYLNNIPCTNIGVVGGNDGEVRPVGGGGYVNGLGPLLAVGGVPKGDRGLLSRGHRLSSGK